MEIGGVFDGKSKKTELQMTLLRVLEFVLGERTDVSKSSLSLAFNKR